MRRGSRACEKARGGAWESSAMMKADESLPGDSTSVDRTATTAGECKKPLINEGCTKGAFIAGMVLQQSWPWWPCDEQGMELQQATACSGVVAPQSNAYAARARVSTARRIGLANRITN